MKTATLILLAAILTGCGTMTPEQRRTAAISIGAGIFVGAIVASQDDNGTQPDQKCYAIVPPGTIQQRLC